MVIQATNLTKKFGDFTAVKGISFSVERGEIFGFLGANGAGKTTAMRILCGLSVPTAGSAQVAGIDVGKNPEAVKRHIGYMSQKFSLYEDLRVHENLKLFGGIYGMDRAAIRRKTDSVLADLKMESERGTLVADLPLGWKQKIAFAVATFHDPDVVFLDEPTGGVDPVTRRRFWESIYAAAEWGITVFVTTHYMDEAEYCDRVSIMVNGEIKALDTPRRLRETYQAQGMDEVFRKCVADRF